MEDAPNAAHRALHEANAGFIAYRSFTCYYQLLIAL
jgi:hypothetical protein